MLTAPEQIAEGATGYPHEPDTMLAAIAQAIVDDETTLAEFTAANVTVIAPQETAEAIDLKVQEAIAKAHGLSLILIAGGGVNPEREADGPRMTVDFELQLYVHQSLRAEDAAKPLALVVALMRFLHCKVLEVAGFQWFEEIFVTGFDPLPDPDFTAYTIRAERDMQL